MTLQWQLAVDGLAQVMLGLVVVVGAGVLLHVSRSLTGDVRRRVTALLVAFAGAMALLVTSDDVLLFYLAWEATSVLSFLLIGTKHGQSTAREAARRALATTGAGGLALLLGIIVLIQSTGERTWSGIIATGVPADTGAVAAALLLGGALTKSAQAPFHRWLPGAMAAPAPVSGYLHSATMVKAGVYLVLRLTPAFSDVAVWNATVLAGAGGAILIGGWRAFRATDLKALLAWSTVSQLGLLMVVVSAPLDKAVLAGVGLVVAHALAKAALFLSVGTIEAGAGTRDVARLRGLARQDRTLGLSMSVALLSLAGVAPLYGFIAKEGALVALLEGNDLVRTSLVVIGSTLTAAYGLRVLSTIWASGTPVAWTRPARRLVFAPGALVLPLVVLGVVWPLGQWVAARGALAVSAGAADKPLVLWPGLGVPLALSVAAVAMGAALMRTMAGRADTPVDDPVVDLAGLLLGLPARAGRVAGQLLHPGQLAPTVGLLLTAAAVMALFPLGTSELLGGRLAELPIAAGGIHAVVVGCMVAAAIVAATRTERFASVLALGVVGFGMVGYFVLINAPDLALTQVLVETIIVLGFLAVLRTRRARGRHTPGVRLPGLVRGGIATIVGLSVAALAVAVSSASRISALGETIVERAYPQGEGRNVVNVILTDVRALDTFGEVVVVSLAAAGAVHLFRRGTEEAGA